LEIVLYLAPEVYHGMTWHLILE